MTEKESLVALVWERCPSKYNGTELLAMVKLAGLSKREGHAYPSMEFLAKSCGVSRRTMQYAISKLKKDKLLTLKRGAGGRHRYFLEPDEIQQLDLAVPRDYQDELPPEPTAEKAIVISSDAKEVAANLEKVIRNEVNGAQIAEDWQTSWPAEIQTLLDAGHDVATIRKTARFAVNHEVWSSTQLAPRGAHGFVGHFSEILAMYKTSIGTTVQP
jgi:DNA-binding transcriptional regulator YhcF (GntR family)